MLRRATLVFLALPLLIFLVGWLRLPLAIGAGAVLLAAVGRLVVGARPTVDNADAPTVPRPWLTLAAIAGPAALLTFLSGAGGWGSGDSDWLKHDTILRDLLARPWPVTYESGHGPVLLVYYTAFYLPAATLGKLAGGSWNVASQTLALTMFAGIVLAGAWLVVLGNPRRWRPGMVMVAVAVFFGFSGLDMVGKALVNLWYGLPVSFGDWSDIEWWAQFAQYPSNAASLFWAPQHAFGGWLPLALALDDWPHKNRLARRAALYLAFALIWSPLAAVGLLPLLAAMIVWRWSRNAAGWTWYAHLPRVEIFRRRVLKAWPGWRTLVTLENVAGTLAGGVFALYLLAHFQAYPLPEAYVVKPGFTPMPLLEGSHFPFALLYVLFVGIEFAGLSAALWWFLAGRPEHDAQENRFLLALATAILLTLPLLRYGYANDLVMRGGLPALFVLQVLLVRMFASAGDGRGRSAAVWVAAALLVVGLGNAALEYRRHVERVLRQGSWRDARTREPVRSLAELQRTIYARPGFDFSRQYLGSADSLFARHLAARRGALGPNPPPRPPPDF